MHRFIIPTLVGLVALAAPAAAQDRSFPYDGRRYDRLEQPGMGDVHELIANWYQQFLHRRPDRGGMHTHVQMFVDGQRPVKVLADIVASGEYYTSAGSTPEGFVRHLYEDLLDRPPTRGEFRHWVGALRSGVSRHRVSMAVLSRYPDAWQNQDADSGYGPYDDYPPPPYRR